MAERGRPLVSIIVPAYNEEDNVDQLEKELVALADDLLERYRFEFIVIDNCSSDLTGEKVKAVCARDERWRYVRFSRNFHVEASLAAGYRLARGDAVVALYSDLQDPPDAIPKLLDAWEQGHDVVYGVRTVRPGDPRWRNAAVRLAYRLINHLSEVHIPPDTGDFRLISRRVCDALNDCPEANRYSRGLIAWLGFDQIGVTYERRPRVAGESKGGFFTLIRIVFTAITGFSARPLRLFTIVGFTITVLSVLAIATYASLWAVGNPPPGTTTITTLVLLSIGINSTGIGLVGEYVGRTHEQVKLRPLYVIDETLNLDGD